MSILFENILGVFEAPAGGFALRHANVYIEHGKIAGIDHAPKDFTFTAKRRIDGRGKLLIPGLINIHTHIPMVFLRNAAEDLTFHEWLFDRILPMEAKVRAEDAYWMTQLGLMEMLRTGTTCFLDMYLFTDAIASAICDAGGRAVLSRGLVGGEGSDVKLKEAVDEIGRWRDRENLSFMMAPHAPYTCDPSYQREIVQTAKQLDVGLHTHISESVREIEEFVAQYGMRPPQMLEETGMLTPRTVGAHCVHVNDADIEILARNGVHVAHNPVSNLKIANGVAPVPKFMAAGINVGIGTDGAASNNTLNMFKDLSVAAIVHKGFSGDPQTVKSHEALQMVWGNGAKALGMGDKIGKIAEGYAADLVMLDLDAPNLRPLNDPIAALAYSTSGHEVELTMVGGKILYENGSFPTMDAERVVREVETTCARIGLRNQ
ncbi:MAG: amidohydrolase [Oscillospiraceae bacterium]|nr:amidohydrolase [Oscillospiraceae bacterium]